MTIRHDDSVSEIRAEKLALIHFTRRPDLVVDRTSGAVDTGWDLLLQVTRDGQETGRLFAVQVKARLRASELGRIVSDRVQLRPSVATRLATQSGRVRDVPFPLCLVVFEMATDAGYYTWLRRPVVDRAGHAGLVTESPSELERLTDDATGRIVDQVNHWYESRR